MSGYSSSLASRGNVPVRGDEASYPALLDDKWVICVAGCDPNGAPEYLQTGSVDVMAPSDADLRMIHTLARSIEVDPTFREANTHQFNGSSASSPHVAGIAALLYSYTIDTINKSNCLAPEDNEFLIKKGASFCDWRGRSIIHGEFLGDAQGGYGLADAGYTLSLIDSNIYRLKHISSDSFIAIKSIVHDSSRYIYMTDRFYQNAIGAWFKRGNYKLKPYKVKATINHNVTYPDTVMYVWPRHSSSNTLSPIKFNLEYSRAELTPHEEVIVVSHDSTKAFVEGYVYGVLDSSNSIVSWWPFDTNLSEIKFAYSILTADRRKLKRDTISEPLEVPLYPKNTENFILINNPAGNSQFIQCYIDKTSYVTIELYNMLGEKVSNVFSGQLLSGVHKLNCDLSIFPNASYIYKIICNQNIYTLKTIKHE